MAAVRCMMVPFVCGVMLTAAWSADAAESCTDAETQAAMNDCSGQTFEEADQALNSIYREIMQRLAGEPETIDRLKQAQRAWISFRDAECSFVLSNAQGTISSALNSPCMADLTQQRAETLRGFLQCEEGDLICPVPDPQ